VTWLLFSSGAKYRRGEMKTSAHEKLSDGGIFYLLAAAGCRSRDISLKWQARKYIA